MNGPDKLIKVIKNPLTDHLPPNARKITLSGDASTVRLSQYLPTLPKDGPIVFFIGAMAHGSDDWVDDIVDDKISLSEYSLSAAVACSKLVRGFLFFLFKYLLGLTVT